VASPCDGTESRVRDEALVEEEEGPAQEQSKRGEDLHVVKVAGHHLGRERQEAEHGDAQADLERGFRPASALEDSSQAIGELHPGAVPRDDVREVPGQWMRDTTPSPPRPHRLVEPALE